MPHNHRPAVGPRETAPDAVVHDPDAAVRDAAPNLRAAFVGLLEPLTEVLGAAA